MQTSSKVAVFTESVIGETFRLAAGRGVINLGQGLPEFRCPPELWSCWRCAQRSPVRARFTAIAERAAEADEDMLRALGWPDGAFGVGIPAGAAASGRGRFITWPVRRRSPGSRRSGRS